MKMIVCVIKVFDLKLNNNKVKGDKNYFLIFYIKKLRGFQKKIIFMAVIIKILNFINDNEITL